MFTAPFLDFKQESEPTRPALQRMDWWDGAGEKKAKGPAGRAQVNRGSADGEERVELKGS